MSHLMTKPTKWVCAQRRLTSAWASALSDQSSLSAWRSFGSLATQSAHSKDSDQTGRMPRLIWVLAGGTLTLMVLSWGGSNIVTLLWTSICTAQLITIMNFSFMYGICPPSCPFLKNNGDKAPKGPSPIIVQEWTDRRPFSDLKYTSTKIKCILKDIVHFIFSLRDN